jgi:hypothetical protein
MQTITSIAGLKNAIQLLEAEEAIKGQLLKEQFYRTLESLKPVNLLKSTLKNIVSSPFLIDNILGITIGLATGYLTKKIVVGASGNIVRKLFGSIIQVGVTKLVAQHPEAIKSSGQFIYQNIHSKKKRISESRER